jgi:hypothetical protein
MNGLGGKSAPRIKLILFGNQNWTAAEHDNGYWHPELDRAAEHDNGYWHLH